MNNISKYYLTFVVIIDLRNRSGGGVIYTKMKFLKMIILIIIYLVNTPGPDICSVHTCAASALVELHHLLTLLEQPEEGGDTSYIEDMGSNSHNMIQNSSQLSKQNPSTTILNH